MITELLRILVRVVEPLALLFSVLVAAGFGVLLVGALASLRKFRLGRRAMDHLRVTEEQCAPAVSIVVPMYNEESVCVSSVRSLLSVRYSEVEVMAVNDGSRDETVSTLRTEFDMVPVLRQPSPGPEMAEVREVYQSMRHPNLFLVDKANGGRSDAVNSGLRYASSPLCCVVDADSVLDPEAISRLVLPFRRDHRTVASGGNVRIVNGCRVQDGSVVQAGVPRGLLQGFQILEYLRAFVAARLGWSRMHLLMIISGALGMFKRDLVLELGGLDTDTIGEDMELTVRLHRHMRETRTPYRIAYVPDAVVWTECPGTALDLGMQRDRWHRGLMEILVKHRKLALNPQYGRIGLIGYPWFVAVEFFGPLIEASGYVILVAGLILGWFQLQSIAAMLLFALALGTLHSVCALMLEEVAFRQYGGPADVARLILLVILENFGYRQMTVYWRLRGIVKYFRGDNSWGEMSRAGVQA